MPLPLRRIKKHRIIKPAQQHKAFFQFIQTLDFLKGILLAFAITVPIALGVYFGYFEAGIAVAVGAFLSSPSDVPGNQKHRVNGILFSVAIAVLASLAEGYLHLNFWLVLPVLGVIMFVLSYISVFGFRASLVSFSGLLAIILSFANFSATLEPYEKAFLIGVGGIWYLLLTLLQHRLNPKGQTEQFLNESLELTGKYLEIRAKLIEKNTDKVSLQKELLQLQTTLIEKQDTLREILISARKSSGKSNYQNKRLEVFIILVDILELAMANPVNYDKTEQLSASHPVKIEAFKNLIFAMADKLKRLSGKVQIETYFPKPVSLNDALKNVTESIRSSSFSEKDEKNQNAVFFQSFYSYQESQAQKINRIEQLLSRSSKEKAELDSENIHKFLVRQDYDPKILTDNFSFKSPVFKHSLRLAFVVMAGYAIGFHFALQNPHWILLTIIVIMRPNYGLTKSRSKERIIGTIIGALVATGIVMLVHSSTVHAILAIATLVMAFAMVQKKYKTSAAFVTISVVFIYALLKADVLDVIQYRVIDTIIGAALSTLGALFLWPAWEMHGMRAVMTESLKTNKDFFNEIIRFYYHPDISTTQYKLCRKQAFIESGNLNTAFQRMTQEPKSKQKNLDVVYEIVALNNSFLSALASAGTYIRNNPPQEASLSLQPIAEVINENLDLAVNLLKDEPLHPVEESDTNNRLKTFFEEKEQHLSTLSGMESQQIAENLETTIIAEQLKWLLSVSEKLAKRVGRL